MPKSKLLLSIFLGLAVVLAQVGTVLAAHPEQDGVSITGTVLGAVAEADPESGSVTCVVALLVSGETTSISVSLETAKSLGLIDLDEKGVPVVDESAFGSEVTVDQGTIIRGEPDDGDKQQPVGSKLAAFFSNFMDIDYELVSNSHTNGFGFGTIAQALWMTKKLGGDATLFQNILTAKQTHNYESVALPNGPMPQTWGQFKKAVLQGERDKNPGDVISDGNELPDAPDQGNSQATPPVQSKDKDDDHGWKKDKPEIPPGQSKDKKDNGNGNDPLTPPGQNKDKDKENNGNSGDPPGQNKDKDKDKKPK